MTVGIFLKLQACVSLCFFFVIALVGYIFTCHKILPLQVYNLVIFLVNLLNDITTTKSVWVHFYSSNETLQAHFTVDSFSRQPLIYLLSVSLNFPFLGISCKWNHTVCGPSCLFFSLCVMLLYL